jgi:hypothetical protein
MALTAGVSGIALAASDPASMTAQPKAEMAAPGKPAMPETMGKSMSEAPKPAQAAKAQKTEPARHHAMVRRSRRQASGDRDTAALNLLESHGYTTITSFRQDGKNYIATVKQHGKVIQVTVDPESHQVRPVA